MNEKIVDGTKIYHYDLQSQDTHHETMKYKNNDLKKQNKIVTSKIKSAS